MYRVGTEGVVDGSPQHGPGRQNPIEARYTDTMASAADKRTF